MKEKIIKGLETANEGYKLKIPNHFMSATANCIIQELERMTLSDLKEVILDMISPEEYD